MPHNQPPPPNHLTPPPKDLVPYTEKRKFDDGIMEDFPPEKKQRLQNFPLANGIGKSAILSRFRKSKNFRFKKEIRNIFELYHKIFIRKFRAKTFELFILSMNPKQLWNQFIKMEFGLSKMKEKFILVLAWIPRKFTNSMPRKAFWNSNHRNQYRKNVFKCSIKGARIMLPTVSVNGRGAQHD